MVSSPYYERLKTFMQDARANKSLDAWDKDHEKALRGFDEAIERLRTYRDSHGFTGATGRAMDRWVDASVDRIAKYKEAYEGGYGTYTRGRGVMATALAEGEKLSADLIDADTAAMRDDLLVSVPDSKPGTGIRFMGKLYTTGAAYVAAVEEQANAQREAAAQRILTMLNSSTRSIGESMGKYTNVAEPGQDLDQYEKQEREKDPGGGGGGGGTSGGGGGTGGGSTGGGSAGGGSAGGGSDWCYGKEDDFGRAGDRSSTSSNYPGGFDQPWWSEADAAAARNRVVASGAVETRELPYGELGSRTNPITDPQDLMSRDLLHTRVNGTTYRNGVIGGHTPAPPADVDHPLWRLNGGAASDSATAGRLGGAGVLGAGALGVRGAARMGSGFGGTGAGGLGVFERSGHGRHARHYWYDQRPGWREHGRPEGRFLLGFWLRLLHSPRRLCGRSRRWRREWCCRLLWCYGHHGHERWRCGCSRCGWQGRCRLRRLHGCWRGRWRGRRQGRQEGP